MSDLPTESNAYHAEHVDLMTLNFRRFLGQDLVPQSVEVEITAEHVFSAPCAILSHGTQDDPIFNYANRTAMELFEMDWDTITQTPSRMSAEPVNRAERERLLNAVSTKNYIDDYAGVRISATGKRFYIPKAIVWNLFDSASVYRGQAATFSEWKFLEQ